MKGICLWIVPLLLAGIAAGDEAAEMELAEKRLLGQLLNAFKGRVNGGADEGATTGSDRDPLSKPNVILFVGDDMGYGDLTSYGHPTQEPGFIDQMAAEGMRFTNGYVADTVCTPSRSAFMTGRLPIRIGTYGNTRVFLPWSKTGLPKSEVTIAEAMQGAGYKTGMVGKWHLGINEETSTDGAHLPFNHGFEYVGHMLPFSNSWQCDDTGLHVDFPSTVQCYLYNNATIVSQPYQHRTLTSLFTNDAVDFVDKNSEDPFFLYVSFAHMHNALFSSDEFECSSRRGRYGDNLNEMHDAVKKIMDAVKANDIDDNTVAFFISDHGPHRECCEEGGDASIFRGGKSLSWEGGHRIPYIVHWPGTVAPGVSNELVTTMDIIATAADLGGTSLPTDREYDGKSIREVILEGGSSPHDAFFYYCKDVLMAVRVGDFKAHFFTQDDLSQSGYGETCLGGFPVNDVYYCHDCSGGCVTSHNPPLLFNLAKDPGEAYPLPPSVYAAQLKSVEEAVKEHKAKLVVAEPLLDTFDVTHSNVPCCNPETNCVCNYEQTPGVADCYADTQMLADMLFVP